MKRKKSVDRQSFSLEARVRLIWGFAIGFCSAFAIGFWNYLLTGVTTIEWQAILICLPLNGGGLAFLRTIASLGRSILAVFDSVHCREIKSYFYFGN